MSERFVVQVDSDQFDRLARPTQPVAGITELVWNALDAEADQVTVAIARTDLGGVDHVLVKDDGHGMTHEEAVRDFRRLGGSWKKNRATSKNGERPLHGKEGVGRFRAFAIGANVDWSTVAEGMNDNRIRTIVSGSLDSSEFVVNDSEELATGDVGTTVTITRPREHTHRLLAEDAPVQIVIQIAVYLLRYPDVAVTYDGRVLDPAAIIGRETTVALDPALGSDAGTSSLRILEWKPEAKSIKPSILLCDEAGVVLHEVTDGVDTRADIPYTAYLSWAGFANYPNGLLLADFGDDILGPLLDAARAALREHIDIRLTERRVELLDRWKAERVYPYKEAPKNDVEERERRVFDVVATAAAPAIAKDPRSARLSLGLIREALAQPPGALHRVLKEVLDLTPSQLEDFDRLLERTSLASVIHTSKLVTDRLEFLDNLQSMLFDREKKQRLLERSQLHRIIANGRSWLFGEQYMVAVDDQGLTKLLEAHRALVQDPTPVTESVTDTEGHVRVVDLMLSKAAFFADRREHLVIELKRPTVRLTQTELGQITNYAVAVARDERFKTPGVKWEFWLLGDDMDEVVEEMTHQRDKPNGLYADGTDYRIWVRRWAELLEENRQRLHFYREHLEYQAREDAEFDELLGKYLPEDQSGNPT